MVDIWRVRNKAAKKYTFRQSHYSGILQRRLDYIFASNSMQYSIKNVEIGTAFLSDHSPVKMTVLEPKNNIKRGSGYWKFNKSILHDPVFVQNIKNTTSELVQEQASSRQKQINWEIMKYEIRKMTIKHSKSNQKKNEDLFKS